MRFSTLAGSALFATLFAALPGLLAPGASKSDLVATARSRYGLGPVTTPGLRTSTPGTTIEQIYTDGEPGLHWTIARKTYGDAYLREVAWPALAGPMRNESDFVCGYDLYLGGNLFDTSGAGIGLQKALRDSLTSVFPSIREVEGIRFALPALDTVEFIVTPQEGYVDLYLRVRLVDATELGVSLPVRLVTRHGAPAVQRMPERPIATSFEGPTKDLILRKAREYGGSGGAVVGLSGCAFGPLGCLLGILFGGQVGGSSGENQAAARIQEEIISGIDRELRALSLGLSHSLGPFHPMSSRPGDTLELRLEGDPIVRPNGISLPLCVQMTTSPPKVDTAISGPTACGSERLQHRDSGSSAPIIGLTLNADAVNQLAHYLWQSGLLRQVGESSVVVDGLSKEVRMAAFDFTGFDPGLPPTLSTRAANPGIPFDLGNVALGSLGPRTVMAHGQATLSVIQDDDSIALHGALGDIWVNCIEPSEAGIDLTPCLSDLVPLMRTLARDATAPKTLFRMARGDILGQLPQLGFFGMRLALSDLQIRTEGTPIRLELRVTAQTQ